MARPLSEDRRNAILSAATELVAQQGLGAATAEIAKRAGVPHGSVFTYFETKGALLNALYLELKTELVDAVNLQPSSNDDVRDQFQHLWLTWTRWGAANPAKRRALAQLGVSDQISELSRKQAFQSAHASLELVRRASMNGALRDAPPYFVGALVESSVSTTTDFMIRQPEQAERICTLGFEAMWKALN
ncbi:TetR/AcrR family transcriptional regulator [Mesorhizobium sp. BR1-1-16]|uniref:TetR/AcrR family transcriptional regulator n=1 Tax=Mesorhizobium sp. BR1-1-16 TaxID=2876653 RepID=UPI001CCC0C1A|nr:TetR/AcrR family transcriptional regulator [Mesorhizobium sp. BR1-1-16]MBZ9935283.1 TetR/AcrR family transcriptional regulator [Mesorhizobium sp. BR1-1-16]